jgi:hypothetical protein
MQVVKCYLRKVKTERIYNPLFLLGTQELCFVD